MVCVGVVCVGVVCVCVFGSSAWCLYGICGHWSDPQWAGMWFPGEPVVLLRSESLLTVPAGPQAAIDSPVWRTSWRIGHGSTPRRVGEIVTAPTMRKCELRWWMCWSTICPKCSPMSDDGEQACTFTVLLGILDKRVSTEPAQSPTRAWVDREVDELSSVHSDSGWGEMEELSGEEAVEWGLLPRPAAPVANHRQRLPTRRLLLVGRGGSRSQNRFSPVAHEEENEVHIRSGQAHRQDGSTVPLTETPTERIALHASRNVAPVRNRTGTTYV